MSFKIALVLATTLVATFAEAAVGWQPNPGPTCTCAHGLDAATPVEGTVGPRTGAKCTVDQAAQCECAAGFVNDPTDIGKACVAVKACGVCDVAGAKAHTAIGNRGNDVYAAGGLDNVCSTAGAAECVCKPGFHHPEAGGVKDLTTCSPNTCACDVAIAGETLGPVTAILPAIDGPGQLERAWLCPKHLGAKACVCKATGHNDTTGKEKACIANTAGCVQCTTQGTATSNIAGAPDNKQWLEGGVTRICVNPGGTDKRCVCKHGYHLASNAANAACVENTCACDHSTKDGTLTAGAGGTKGSALLTGGVQGCMENGVKTCQCDAGYHNDPAGKANACIINKCRCTTALTAEAGTKGGATGTACAIHNELVCGCDAGYRPDPAATRILPKKCLKNVCKCTKKDDTTGTAIATDALCTAHDQELCMCTKAGYSHHELIGAPRISKDAVCQANVCTCNGTAGGPIKAGVKVGTKAEAADGTCTTNGRHICTACEGDRKLTENGDKEKTCYVASDTPYTCTCGAGGTAKKNFGEKCWTKSGEDCVKCASEDKHKMYTIAKMNVCKANTDKPFTCTCENGTAAANWGEGCFKADGKGCKECTKAVAAKAKTATQAEVKAVPAYTLNKATAACEKTCACPGGKGFVGKDCPKHGDAKCKSCNSGYAYDKKKFKCNKEDKGFFSSPGGIVVIVVGVVVVLGGIAGAVLMGGAGAAAGGAASSGGAAAGAGKV